MNKYYVINEDKFNNFQLKLFIKHFIYFFINGCFIILCLKTYINLFNFLQNLIISMILSSLQLVLFKNKNKTYFNKKICNYLINKIFQELSIIEKKEKDKKFFNKICVKVYYQIDLLKKETAITHNYDYCKFCLNEIFHTLKSDYSNFPVEKAHLILSKENLDKLEEDLLMMGLDKKTRNLNIIAEQYKYIISKSNSLNSANTIYNTYSEIKKFIEDFTFY